MRPIAKGVRKLHNAKMTKRNRPEKGLPAAITAKRKALGLTQEAAAGTLNISLRSWIDYEFGVKPHAPIRLLLEMFVAGQLDQKFSKKK